MIKGVIFKNYLSNESIEKNVPDKRLIGTITKFETVLWASQVKDKKPVTAPIDENIIIEITK